MIEIVPKIQEFVLHGGRKLFLEELSLFDMADGEKELGRPHDEWIELIPSPTPDNPDRKVVKIKDSLRTCACFLWLMARKHGLERKDILARRWPFTIDDLMLEMNIDDLGRAGEVIVKTFCQREPGGPGARPGNDDA